MSTKLEIGAAVGLVGAGVFQLHSAYAQHAGSLPSVRSADPNDAGTAQRLMDADVLVGGMTLIVGGAISLATRQVYPLILALLGYSLTAWYYHTALRGPSIQSEERTPDDSEE